MNTQVLALTELRLAEGGPAADLALRAAEAIFWETAYRRDFPSAAERVAFRRRYFGYYGEAAPEYFLVARVNDQDPAAQGSLDAGAAAGVFGYICGVADTRRHLELYEIADHVPLFDDLYAEFPAHLHINLTAKARGRGIGGMLVERLAEAVSTAGACGLHLVTGPEARNTSFYRRQGFVREVRRELPAPQGPGTELLFMGRLL